jgi:formamidopyrimidine-DNA glycosylase
LAFAGGSFLLLVDPRRLARVRLDPPVDALGPDAREVTAAEFRALVSRGTAPVKARLLDQDSVAGVGNLIADEALWRAKINPARPVDQLTRAEVDRLYRAVRRSVDAAVEGGGVHTLSVVPARIVGGLCPRCGAPMVRGTVGSRTTFWCSREQA